MSARVSLVRSLFQHMKSISPSYVGAAAESVIQRKRLLIRPIAVGPWMITGEFGVDCGNAHLYSGIDEIYSWADGTIVQWRFFALQPGITLTLQINVAGFIATYNPITAGVNPYPGI